MRLSQSHLFKPETLFSPTSQKYGATNDFTVEQVV